MSTIPNLVLSIITAASAVTSGKFNIEAAAGRKKRVRRGSKKRRAVNPALEG